MPTMLDVAKHSGVAQCTVSRVLNGLPGVRPETRERVLRAAAELDYYPSAPARALAGGGMHTLGVIVYQVSDAYYAGILRGATQAANDQGYHILFASTYGEKLARLNPVESLFAQGKVDGLVIIGNHVEDNEYMAKLVDSKIPYVLVERYTLDPRVNCIDVDNRQGAYLAARHLARLGHRRIAHLAGDRQWQQALDRVAGYREALDETKQSYDGDLVMYCDFNYDKAYQAMMEMFSLVDPPTAVFAADDVMACAAMNAAHDTGRHVPGDFAAVGFDDISLASWWRPRLTTVRQPTDAMGECAVEILLREVMGSVTEKTKRVFPLELIVRESCGAAKNSRASADPI